MGRLPLNITKHFKNKDILTQKNTSVHGWIVVNSGTKNCKIQPPHMIAIAARRQWPVMGYDFILIEGKNPCIENFKIDV